MSRLTTGCDSLDTLLGGGVETGAITLVYGEAGTGKTNLCLQLTREAIRSRPGKVAYVDTEGVSSERLRQIAGDEASRVLEQTLFFSPQGLDEQVQAIRGLSKLPKPSLVLVDSLNMYYRLALSKNGSDEPTRLLTQALGDLLALTRTADVPVVVTAQVYQQEDVARAWGGRTMEHIVKAIVRLDRLAPGVRRATLLKHRSRPEGETAGFRIVAEGLAAGA